MDPSKPAKGILASLEHKAVEPPRRAASAAPSAGRGAALVVSAGVLIGALLAWWLSSGPSPVIVQEPLPPFVQTVPAQPEPTPVAESAAAAIVDEAPAPILPSSAAAPPAPAMPARVPVAPAAKRHDRVALARSQPKPKPKVKQPAVPREQVRRAPRAVADTDVALLSALVAHGSQPDVIEPRTGDSTAGLLQRCRRVGGEEGRLCRIRICSSRVGTGACDVE